MKAVKGETALLFTYCLFFYLWLSWTPTKKQVLKCQHYICSCSVSTFLQHPSYHIHIMYQLIFSRPDLYQTAQITFNIQYIFFVSWSITLLNLHMWYSILEIVLLLRKHFHTFVLCPRLQTKFPFMENTNKICSIQLCLQECTFILMAVLLHHMMNKDQYSVR